MLYIPRKPADATTRQVTGQFLAKNRLSKRDRARLAAEIASGRTVISKLTVKQIAALCGVSVPYVVQATQPDRAVAQLLRTWSAATHDQQVSFARAAGTERVLDVLALAAA